MQQKFTAKLAKDVGFHKIHRSDISKKEKKRSDVGELLRSVYTVTNEEDKNDVDISKFKRN